MNIQKAKICYLVLASVGLAFSLASGDYAGAAVITATGFMVASA